MNNKNVHISGWYTIVGAVIGAILSAGCTYYLTSKNNEVVEQEYQILQSRIVELENENEELKFQLNLKDPDISTDSNKNEEKDLSVSSQNTNVTNLFDMKGFIGKTEDLVSSSVDFEDNVGNTYPGGYSIYYDGTGNMKDREVTYLLEKKYTTLRGIIALRSSENDIRDGVWLEFYENDTLIYSTEHLYAGVLPIEFSIDVSRVDRLKVKANGGNQSAFILTNGLYLE